MCDQSQVRHGVMLPLLRDPRGHGKSNDHFLWSEISGGMGLRVVRSSCQRVRHGLLMFSQAHSLTPLKPRGIQDGTAKRHVVCRARGHRSNLEPRQPGVRASSAAGAGQRPSFGCTDGERDKCHVADHCKPALFASAETPISQDRVARKTLATRRNKRK